MSLEDCTHHADGAHLEQNLVYQVINVFRLFGLGNDSGYVVDFGGVKIVGILRNRRPGIHANPKFGKLVSFLSDDSCCTVR